MLRAFVKFIETMPGRGHVFFDNAQIKNHKPKRVVFVFIGRSGKKICTTEWIANKRAGERTRR